jgi:LacI family transcriptional regulator
LKKRESSKTNITVQDIAKAINISASTVSRALNNHPKISQKTKEKVWEAAQKLGYQPNIPVYLNQKQTRSICIMVPEINNTYYLDIIESVRKYAVKQNYHLYIAPTDNSLSSEELYVQSIINLKIEGVIVTLFKTDNNLEHLESLLNYNIPTIFINKNESKIESTSIIPDIFHGAYKAATHLISMKCKNIHLFVTNADSPLYADLIEGYSTAIDEHENLLLDKHIYTNLNSKEAVEHLLETLNKKNKLPDGIIAGNHEISELVVSWFENAGLQIPDNLLLVGFNTGLKDDYKKHTISSIIISGSKIGKIAAESLFKQIHSRTINKETIIVPAKFIIKGSSMRF